ncbi:titin-like isoform X1 [Galleria mellonella]|uniref:Titin-like isoform X1 n=2 Tax=Galleria mellonella TaxID=7137 RepID=A0A6J1X1L4_GALME|nr:titin-like isoform X1 [Galleria mellonella]
MESQLLPDKKKSTPPVPIKTYQWEDLRRAREAGGYPWTHLLKAPLVGEITAEDIIRETTPRRSMSREVSRSRTRSPVDGDVQRILNLDSSPGSSRKHGEEGDDEGVHVPNFSKEVSLDSEDDVISQAVQAYMNSRPESQASSHLATPVEIPKNVSPKSILKRRVPEQNYIGISETREKTKCCHPLVNKIKHLADKTLHKLDRGENEKSPVAKRKKNDDSQEIRQLKSSPGAVRRQKFSAIKLGDSDEMSKTMSIDTPPPRKKREHIYEDIAESKSQEIEKSLHFSPEVEKQDNKSEEDTRSNSNKENESLSERKSIASHDPSLVTENTSLKSADHIMEKLHKNNDIDKEAVLLDEEMDPDEPNVDEIFQNQLEETRPKNDSPNITITEIIDEDIEVTIEQTTTIPIESSPTPSPRDNREKNFEREWSKPSSDHEYEIIEKPPPNIIYTAPSVDEKPKMTKTDDELSSTTSLERKYLQHTSDDEEQMDEKENFPDENIESIVNAETLQKNIEDRYFANTPSTVSRTECEISTSQVDSSALENLPLKRDSRRKKENTDNRMQQRIKEGTSKIKTQAGKIKTKLQNIKTNKFTMPERPKINFPERPKFKMPDRPKISLPERPKFTLPERPKFTLPDRRKFSLPDRPKLKKINFTEKLSLGDRKKFTFPERPKFNVPEFPKFKMPERPKINFPSLSRKKEYKVENDPTESSDDFHNVATVDFEVKTYPRLFNRKKKSELQKTSSSPTLNREDTPPATFTFTRVNQTKDVPSTYIPDSPEQPREYGNVDSDVNFETETEPQREFDVNFSFNKDNSKYIENEPVSFSYENDNRNGSVPDFSPSNQEYTHVINEIDNDEFFVRPRGISRENIQVREYLSDEIRQAFKIPKNILALMGSNSGVNDENMYVNEPEADPELMIDDNEQMRYSTEDLNERDDGYYTFPPVRPSRAKRKKKVPEPEPETIQYIDDSVNASMQFSEVDLGLPDDHPEEQHINEDIVNGNVETIELNNRLDFTPITDLHSIHEYANDDVIEYPENTPIQSQTLPMPPKRKKKFSKKDFRHSSLNDFKDVSSAASWEEPNKQDDIIVYRTEHEYIVPQDVNTATEQSPVPPRRNRSRSSRCTSLCDDDRTSHGAESLTLDTHVPPSEEVDIEREVRHESPGYATVDKGPYAPSKADRRSKSKTPPVRRRKSNSSERKYYTVGPTKPVIPDRPPRKKSSTSLMTLESFKKRSVSGDLTQYVEIDEPQFEEIHKDLKSGEVVSKMKDRPLPPPPRPPRGPKRKKKDKEESEEQTNIDTEFFPELSHNYVGEEETKTEDVVEIEVSTQTDPLPDDVDFELGMEENLDVSMSSSLKDFVDEESLIGKPHTKHVESPRESRPTSRSEKSLKISDPKISDLSNIGRTSPTVILVERRVSSPTRINERDVMLTEASLTVQHIDIDESQIPDVPPLPRSRGTPTTSPKNISQISEERALERIRDSNREVQLDNLVTQRLQVKDLDVGRLNVSELQASKILVSDIEGMTLQVAELDSKSGHISVSGIEFSQTVIDEIVKKFAEISTNQAPPSSQVTERVEHPRTVIREEQTQTDEPSEIKIEEKLLTQTQTEIKPEAKPAQSSEDVQSPSPPPRTASTDESTVPPQRPPPPDLTPLLYSYLQDMTLPPASYYPLRTFRERPYTDYHDTQHQSPPPPTRRAKRKPAAPHTESSSDEDIPCSSSRGMPPPVRTNEPSITEAGAEFLRVCHNSISRTIRNIFNTFMAYINRTEDKKDVQMALVIFLVLVAGLIMFGLSDSRAIHHHHWEFFNPPDGKQ